MRGEDSGGGARGGGPPLGGCVARGGGGVVYVWWRGCEMKTVEAERVGVDLLSGGGGEGG